jgi:hypothetical protein
MISLKRECVRGQSSDALKTTVQPAAMGTAIALEPRMTLEFHLQSKKKKEQRSARYQKKENASYCRIGILCLRGNGKDAADGLAEDQRQAVRRGALWNETRN